ncbi:MAG: exopolyphosphatase [Paracoccaceae bacterium]
MGVTGARAGGQGDFFGGYPPSFAPADPRADRIGVVDVGSNSVRLVVFEGHCRAPQVIFNEKVTAGLGARLEETRRLDPEGVERAIRALRRFAGLAPQLKIAALAGVATAAVREAEDGAAFRDRVERETGIRLRIASGIEEAELAAKGVLFGQPRAHGVAVDLGGGSAEFCRIEEGQLGPGLSTPLGPLRLRAIERQGRDVRAEIAAYLRTMTETFGLAGGRLYLVGGAWRALAKLAIARGRYPLQIVHEYEMTAGAARELADWVVATKPEKIAQIDGVPAGRAAAMPLSAALLAEIVRTLEPGVLTVSAFGLREGVCLDNLSPALRREDPLLAAARDQETRRARAPGYGADLADWLLGAFPARDPEDERLVRALAHLADVNWRTHPDYRAEGCWETVTRGSLTDIGHAGRAFLGAALVGRYRGTRKALGSSVAGALLGEDRLEEARRLGLAMRVAAVLAGSAPGILGATRLAREGGTLRLTIAGPAISLRGEEVDKRLDQLAKALGATAAISERTTNG